MSTATTGLRGLLTPDRVQLGVEVADWRAAVREVGALLVATGAVEPRSVDAMIATSERFGPYIVIAPGLALPHSAPEDGAITDGLALLVLTTPVEFGNADNDPVHVVLALSATDRAGHLDQLREISESLQRLSTAGDDWAPLRAARTPEEAIDLLAGGQTDEGATR